MGIERTALAVPAWRSLFVGRRLEKNLRVQLIEHTLLLHQVCSKSVDVPVPLYAILAFQLHRVPGTKLRKLARIGCPNEYDGDGDYGQSKKHPYEQSKQGLHTHYL
jgi:hypothetical protein